MAGPRNPEHEQLRTWASAWTDRFDLVAVYMRICGVRLHARPESRIFEFL